MNRTTPTVRPIFLAAFLALMFISSGCLFAAGAPRTLRQYLSGTDKDHTVPWQFYCDHGQHSGTWSTIAVPSNWELQGYGTYTYGVDIMAAMRAATRTGADRSMIEVPVHAQYKYNFNVPAEWAQKRVFLVFEGSMTDTEVSVNGQSAGPIHRGGYYRFRYDVSRLIKFGSDNLLAVAVTDVSSDPTVNNAERHGDYWNYGGIYRPVYLEAFPAEYIDRIAVDARADGSLAVNAFVSAGIAQADHVEAQVYDLGGKAVGQAFSVTLDSANASQTLKSKFDGVQQWSAEFPNLYRLVVRLKQGSTVLHEISKNIGFRTIEVRTGDGVYVNGQRVMLKGCCRHTFWPESGRCTSEELSELDVNTIKGMNMNAVRSTHYPSDQHFLDKCDELGLYVLDELAGWHAHYGTPVGTQLVEEMVTRDVNHPCILFWDNGNEGGWNNELNGEFDKWDPQNRHVLHPWEKFGGINTKHYPDLTLAKKLAAGTDVFMPTEFDHGLFDGGAGTQLSQFWDIMRHSKVSAGGFIWAYLDEAVKRTDLDGRLDGNGNEAPDGIVGPHREKEASYFTIKQVWSPIQIATPKAIEQKLSLDIENSYAFTDLNQCSFKWELRHFASPGEDRSGFEVLSSGAAKSPRISPWTSGKLELGLPADWQKADGLAVIATDPHGKEVWTWVWPIDDQRLREMPIAKSGQADASYTEDADNYTLTAGDLSASISKSTGELASVKVKGQLISMAAGPRLVVGESKIDSIKIARQDHTVRIEAVGSSGLKKIVWTLAPSGELSLEYEYEAGGVHPFSGITFDYPPANVKAKKWLGVGPYRVYANRLEGGTLNVWDTPYNDAVTGQTWQYPEFKGYFPAVRWMTLSTTEGPITIVPGSDDLFVRVLTSKFPEKKLAGNTIVPFPPGDISFLNTIPLMGSKFRAAPPSPTIAEGTYGGKVTFYFGDLKP
ncbi:MAG: glycoside hydrolase family 2 [Planctomycetota bacterium]|nr:glycoside hydrolase family 2 [Planctomycetota bacterium]